MAHLSPHQYLPQGFRGTRALKSRRSLVPSQNPDTHTPTHCGKSQPSAVCNGLIYAMHPYAGFSAFPQRNSLTRHCDAVFYTNPPARFAPRGSPCDATRTDGCPRV